MYQIQFSRGLDALPLAKELRRKVFITEQGFQNEFDDIDRTAWHVLISEGGFPCGTGRVFETPAAITSEIAKMAVGGSERAISRPQASAPESKEESHGCKYSGRIGRPNWANALL